MASIEVDVDLDDFHVDDIVDALLEKLRNRSIRPQKERQLKKLLEELIKPISSETLAIFEIKTLDDQMKIEHLKAVFDKYTPSEIENRLP